MPVKVAQSSMKKNKVKKQQKKAAVEKQNLRHREEFNRLLTDAVLGVKASGRT